MPRGNIHGRLKRLEANAPRPPKPPSRESLNLRAILNEFARLKSSCAVHYRGGTPIVRIEPEDIPGKILGPGYTQRELCELAVRRALEARGEPETEVPRYVEALKEMWGTRRDDWEEPVQGGGMIPIG